MNYLTSSKFKRSAIGRWTTLVVLLSTEIIGSVHAQNIFILSSPAIVDGATLPADLKCTRDGGQGLSPPLQWTSLPKGTESLAVIMHHYPRGAEEGADAPSQYWLLWNVPSDTEELVLGNPASIGDEGSDKDGRRTGYTPPCSPPGSQHEYTITLFALSSPLDTLPTQDNIATDWLAITNAMDGKIIASSYFTFLN